MRAAAFGVRLSNELWLQIESKRLEQLELGQDVGGEVKMIEPGEDVRA